jgi:hypothetical protein
MSSRFVRVILIPAGVFQSVIFGGAYGTGREIAQFISSLGPVGGLLAIAVAGLGFGVAMALSFELARLGRTYDYSWSRCWSSSRSTARPRAPSSMTSSVSRHSSASECCLPPSWR